MLPQVDGNRRILIAKVTENPRVYRADIDTGWCSCAIDPRSEPARETVVNALHAEGAFLNNTARSKLDFSHAPFGLVWVLSRWCFPVETAHIVRASHLTIPAADAAFVIHR